MLKLNNVLLLLNLWFSTSCNVCKSGRSFHTSNYLTGSFVFVLFTPVAGYFSCSMHALSSSSLYANEYWLKEQSITHYIVTQTHTHIHSHTHTQASWAHPVVPWLWKVSFDKLWEHSSLKHVHPNGGSLFYYVDGCLVYDPPLRRCLLSSLESPKMNMT